MICRGKLNPLFLLPQPLKTMAGKAGDVAQLARALAWHARGQGFESPYLHKSSVDQNFFYVLPLLNNAE